MQVPEMSSRFHGQAMGPHLPDSHQFSQGLRVLTCKENRIPQKKGLMKNDETLPPSLAALKILDPRKQSI